MVRVRRFCSGNSGRSWFWTHDAQEWKRTHFPLAETNGGQAWGRGGRGRKGSEGLSRTPDGQPLPPHEEWPPLCTLWEDPGPPGMWGGVKFGVPCPRVASWGCPCLHQGSSF